MEHHLDLFSWTGGPEAPSVQDLCASRSVCLEVDLGGTVFNSYSEKLSASCCRAGPSLGGSAESVYVDNYCIISSIRPSEPSRMKVMSRKSSLLDLQYLTTSVHVEDDEEVAGRRTDRSCVHPDPVDFYIEAERTFLIDQFAQLSDADGDHEVDPLSISPTEVLRPMAVLADCS